MSNDRRNFLKQVGTGVAAAAAISKISEQSAGAAENFQALAAPRQNNQIKLALELDGEFAGWLQSVEGGDAIGEVVESVQESGVIKKHIGSYKYDDISVSCSTSMSKGLYEWIKASFDQKPVRKAGAIVAADFDFNVASTMEFFDALITEIGFPALDAGSKDAAKMTLKFSPELTRTKVASGRPVLNEADDKKNRPVKLSNFRLKIDGLEEASSRVRVVEDLNIKFTLADIKRGDGETFKEPGKIEFPNLRITLAQADADQFQKWHESFVIKGESGSDQEHKGSLEFLDDHKAPLFALEFKNLGIFKFAPDKISTAQAFDGKHRQERQVKVEMYCDELKLTSPELLK